MPKNAKYHSLTAETLNRVLTTIVLAVSFELALAFGRQISRVAPNIVLAFKFTPKMRFTPNTLMRAEMLDIWT